MTIFFIIIKTMHININLTYTPFHVNDYIIKQMNDVSQNKNINNGPDHFLHIRTQIVEMFSLW